MGKKIIGIVLLLGILVLVQPTNHVLAEESERFSFDLSVDGETTKEVYPGDIITVVLKLRNIDSTSSYKMYAMQDEIRYDSTFFELVEGSEILHQGVVSNDIAKVDGYREFYMNFLSMSGGTSWEADTIVGSFQLKVIGNKGVTKITNEDYLVSFKDGSGSYEAEANDLMIIISTDCTVQFMSNGGSEIKNQVVQYGETIIPPKDPTRKGYQFEGWYRDIHLTEGWNFEEDVVEKNMTLYAKWTKKVPSPDTGDNFQWWIAGIIPLSIIMMGLSLWRRKKHII